MSEQDFADRLDWLKLRAPAIGEKVQRQLVKLFPLVCVLDAERHYLDRMAIAATREVDSDTGATYMAIVWHQGGDKRRLRLYVGLPTKETFLYEQSMNKAVELLTLEPPLPKSVKRGVEDYIRKYVDFSLLKSA